MEGTCTYCGSGTSLLEEHYKDGVGNVKVCPDCKEQYLNTGNERDGGGDRD